MKRQTRNVQRGIALRGQLGPFIRKGNWDLLWWVSWWSVVGLMAMDWNPIGNGILGSAYNLTWTQVNQKKTKQGWLWQARPCLGSGDDGEIRWAYWKIDWRILLSPCSTASALIGVLVGLLVKGQPSFTSG